MRIISGSLRKGLSRAQRRFDQRRLARKAHAGRPNGVAIQEQIPKQASAVDQQGQSRFTVFRSATGDREGQAQPDTMPVRQQAREQPSKVYFLEYYARMLAVAYLPVLSAFFCLSFLRLP